MPTTEIANLTLVAGSNIGDPNNQASAVLKECSDVLANQDGMQQMKFGMQIENPDILSMFIDWDSLGHHEKFMAADAYQPFFKKFSSIMSGPPELVHVDLKPERGATAAFSAPVTEVATFYYDGEPPSDTAETTEKIVEAFEKGGGPNLLGWACGHSHETLEKDGAKGKAVILVAGWASVEAHMEARESPAFKEIAPTLFQGHKAVEVHHVAVMDIARE